MKFFPFVNLGGGVVAGYTAKEFVALSGKKGGLAIVTAENALPYERQPLAGFCDDHGLIRRRSKTPAN